MARKKLKLAEKVISEILSADTDTESGAEANNIDCFEDEEEEEEEEQQQQNNISSSSKPQQK